MDFKMIDPMTLYVLIGGVLVIFVGLGLRQVETLQKTVPLWLWSGLAGILIGAGIAAFVVHKIESLHAHSKADLQVADSKTASPALSAMDGGGAQPSAGRSGSGAGGGGGGGGGGAPRARRDLTALVGKLALVTRGVQLNLDAEQKAKLSSAIEALDKNEEMTEEVAKEHLDAINAILTAENAQVLASIDLPRPTRAGSSGGAAGPGGAMPRPVQGAGPGPVSAANASVSGGGSPGMGGSPQSSNENPFKQEDNAKRLSHLREQISTP